MRARHVWLISSLEMAAGPVPNAGQCGRLQHSTVACLFIPVQGFKQRMCFCTPARLVPVCSTLVASAMLYGSPSSSGGGALISHACT